MQIAWRPRVPGWETPAAAVENGGTMFRCEYPNRSNPPAPNASMAALGLPWCSSDPAACSTAQGALARQPLFCPWLMYLNRCAADQRIRRIDDDRIRRLEPRNDLHGRPVITADLYWEELRSTVAHDTHLQTL
jgi:hypothetical protein